jgi:hypothetical protein
MNGSSDNPKPNDGEVFLKFHFAEAKDLAKHFLTIIAAVLTFSIAFAEKFIGISSAAIYVKVALVACWLFLILALIACGLGLYLIFLAGEKAAGGLIYNYRTSFKELARKAYFCLDCAGVLFVLGILIMILLGSAKIF